MPASIQEIKTIKPAENSDNLELAEVLGYQCVVLKDKFKAGQAIVFIEIDSVVPDWPEYEFLKGHRRIKTVRLRGNISQGLIMAFSDYKKGRLFLGTENSPIGHDLSTELNIAKYEKEVPHHREGKGNFPEFIPKTDEVNVQSKPGLIEEIKGKKLNATLKMDGTSCTIFVKDGTFGVCSRNQELKEGNNPYWRIAKKYEFESALESYDNIAIQGEICGPGVQKNPTGLTELKFYIFNVFDIESQTYYTTEMIYDFIRRIDSNRSVYLQLNVAPRIPIDIKGSEVTIKGLIDLAKKQTYQNGKPAEGMVVRPVENVFSEILRKRLSFKVLNPNYKEN